MHLLYLAFYVIYIVLWCVSSGYSCGKEVCKTWNEYFDNFHECRTNGAVDRLTTFFLSFIPFLGLNNFYRGDPVIGFCELINGITMVISITALCNCHNPNARRYNHEASLIAIVVGIVIAFLDILKVMHIIMVYENGSIDIFEIIILIISIAIIWGHCVQQEYPIVCAFNVSIATGLLELLKDIVTAIFYSKDGNGCPFV